MYVEVSTPEPDSVRLSGGKTLKIFFNLVITIGFCFIMTTIGQSTDPWSDVFRDNSTYAEEVTISENDYKNQPVWGNRQAAVKVVFFQDFMCPHCATFTEDVQPQLIQAYEDNEEVAFFFFNWNYAA